MTRRGRRWRILHLIDQPGPARGGDGRPDPDAALLLCAHLTRRLPAFEQTVCLIGGNALEERAAAAGLATTDRIAPPLGLAVRAGPGLRSYLRDRGMPDAMHCWSVPTLSLAAGTAGAPVCATPIGPVSRAVTGAARVRSRKVRLSVFSDAEGWSRALGAGPGAPPACPIPRVAGEPDGQHRKDARRLMRVKESDTVILLIGGAPGEADAMRLVALLGLLHVAERPAVWVAPASSARLARALRFHARSGRLSRLIVTQRPPAAQFAGADLAVWLGGAGVDAADAGPSPAGAVLIGASLAAGLPVVAPRSALVEGLYPGATGNGCLAFNATIAEMARVLLPLVGDERRRAALRRDVTDEPPASGPSFEDRVAEQWLDCLGSRAAWGLAPAGAQAG